MTIRRIFGGLWRTARHTRPLRPAGACSARSGGARRRDHQSGYAFLMALGLIIIMSLASLAILQRGATIRRRQVEQETIWRGNQYVRAIRLYYHKTGHYPQTLDDLSKGLPDLHFLRQAYKNPTNPADGSWRFIYVNAAGQIIGSTRYATLQQMALMDANGGQLPSLQGQPGQPGVPVSSLGDSSGVSGSQPRAKSFDECERLKSQQPRARKFAARQFREPADNTESWCARQPKPFLELAGAE